MLKGTYLKYAGGYGIHTESQNTTENFSIVFELGMPHTLQSRNTSISICVMLNTT